MKQKVFFLLIALLLLGGTSNAQKKVAVYVTPSENIDDGTKKIVGSELVSAIVKNKDFSAVERTSDFLSRISAEHEYQRGGAVDNLQLSELGKQFGADYVCVADIIAYKESYYIQARLINVKEATVTNTAKQISRLDGISEIVNTAEKIATDLFGMEQLKDTKSAYYDKNYSTCITQPENAKIKNIEVTEESTDVYIIVHLTGTKYFGISPQTYILDKSTNSTYELISADNISIIPEYSYPRKEEQKREIVLHFDPIPLSTKKISIIEPALKGMTGWVWDNITLNPYILDGNYVFEIEHQTVTPKKQNSTGQHKYSACLIEPSNITLNQILVDNNFTYVYCTFTNDWRKTCYLAASPKMYIQDVTTGRKYWLRDVKNIPLLPKKGHTDGVAKYEFVLKFEPIPQSTKEIDIVQPKDKSISSFDNFIFLNFKTITLILYQQEEQFRQYKFL
ncbi:MAG: hypothetical protein IKR83_02280 [Bacteroidales bacterium]|nr:hypothetical protein [Bacteroidales bacterium]